MFAVQELMAEDMAYREAMEYLKGQDFEVNIGALEDVQDMYFLMFVSFFCICMVCVRDRIDYLVSVTFYDFLSSVALW